MKFEEMKLDGRTLKSIKNHGYEDATEVQEKSIPQVIAGRNLIVRSQTGTGKTAAFGIGLMERIVSGKTKKALVLVPTRELAAQVCKELRGLSQVHQLKIYPVFGGQSINVQLRDLNRNYDILVATPGRLLDFFRRGKVNLSKFDAIVLDEADHMLDMGFKTEVFSIMDKLSTAPQVLLFSATVDESIKKIISRYMSDPEEISIGNMEVVSSIKEEKIEIPHSEKFRKLIDILNSHKGMKIIVFARTKRGVMGLKKRLEKSGLDKVGMLQGDMPQKKRIRVLAMFKENQLTLLIATNVASRGLQIDNVELIINYDEAEDKETHLHRVGRTGRMGKEGKVINLISPDAPRLNPNNSWRSRKPGNFGRRNRNSGKRPSGRRRK